MYLSEIKCICRQIFLMFYKDISTVKHHQNSIILLLFSTLCPYSFAIILMGNRGLVALL